MFPSHDLISTTFQPRASLMVDSSDDLTALLRSGASPITKSKAWRPTGGHTSPTVSTTRQVSDHSVPYVTIGAVELAERQRGHRFHHGLLVHPPRLVAGSGTAVLSGGPCTG